MDEPSMGLTLKARGCRVLLVEQPATAALSIADRAYVLQPGEVQLSGPARDLLRDQAVMRAYLGAKGESSA